MENMALNAKLRILYFCFILFTLNKLLNAETSGSKFFTMESCGILYAKANSQGSFFPLDDQDQAVDLLEDQRSSVHGWNETGSVVVQNGCKIKACNDSYFDGFCQNLEAGSYPVSEFPEVAAIASVSCSCPKQCDCSAIYVKKSSCGRAYLEGGCSTCHALYVDLDKNTSNTNSFKNEFSNKVTAFRLRKGCSLTVYTHEDFTGRKQVFEDETVENFHGKIGSYECNCDDERFVPRQKPPRPESYPPIVNVASDMNQVVKMLSMDEFKSHVGLNAARKSYKNKRSPKNAYILILGTTGSGKSSAINLLFDNPNITKVGHKESTTTDIHEFRIPVPVDELGISNSELRVIDTPGLGDTRGLEQDAKFLATLDNYLATHEELKDRIPNIVLIVHNFFDNRFDGPGARFVKMVRGFDSFRDRITDKTFSNVVFLFTHYMALERQERRRPAQRVNDFKQVIQGYTLLPRPTHIVLAENKAKEEQLPMTNGFYRLPNNDYYPRNLFEKMDLITEKCGDPIGQGVFRTAFRDSENFTVSRVDYTLLSSNTSLVQQYLGVLTHADLNVNNTEVSQSLQSVWASQVSASLKRRYPLSLSYLQKALNLRNINDMQHVPRTTPKILELFAALKQDPATIILLDKGLSIQAPAFPQPTLVGYGYHVFEDRALPTSPFKWGELQSSDLGFRLSSTLSCKPEPGSKEQFGVFQNKGEYMQYRLQSLGIQGNISVDKFTDAVQPGCNIDALSFRNDSCSVSATKIFHSFQLLLNNDWTLNPEFENAVKALNPVNTSDHESVTKWTEFFSRYGTHVVKSAFGGGSIQVRLESDQPYNPGFREAMFHMVKYADDLSYDLEHSESPGMETGNSVTVASAQPSKDGENEANSNAQEKETYQYSTNFVGGNPTFHSTNLGKMPLTEASKLLANWKQSLRVNPAMLTTEIRLLPISRIAESLGQNYTEEIDRATELLFSSDLIYKPTGNANGPGFSRDDTPAVKAMMEMMQKQFDKIDQMKNESLKAQHELELRRLEIEERRMELQINATLDENKFRRELELKKLEQENARFNQSIIRDQASHAHEQKLAELKRDADVAAQNRRESHEERMARIAAEARVAALEAQKRLKEAKPGTNCLKAGTLILMGDGTQKSVELLKFGDFVMDMTMQPSKVLGVAREFLLKQGFYGFYKNGPFFFTSNHLFVGPSNEHSNRTNQLFAASTSNLIQGNPLMTFRNVQILAENTQLYCLSSEQNSQMKLATSNITGVFQDAVQYSEDTIVYDLLVESPTGTYFANGHLCSQELPPLEIWPNTMSILFRLLETPVFTAILPSVPYTREHVYKIFMLVDELVEVTTRYLNNWKWDKLNNETANTLRVMTLKEINIEEAFIKLFNSSCASAAALRLYASVGPAIAQRLDTNDKQVYTNELETAFLQHELLNMLNNELEIRFM